MNYDWFLYAFCSYHKDVIQQNQERKKESHYKSGISDTKYEGRLR